MTVLPQPHPTSKRPPPTLCALFRYDSIIGFWNSIKFPVKFNEISCPECIFILFGFPYKDSPKNRGIYNLSFDSR